MNDPSWVAVVLALSVPVFGFLGVIVGLWGSREREIREMRKRAYVEWLQAAEQFPLFEGAVGGAGVEIPTQEMIVRMLDVVAELSLVAPVEILNAVNAYTATITSDGYRSAMNGAMATDSAAILVTHQLVTKSVRRDAAGAMRKDLPWWRSKTRELPLRAQEPRLDKLP
jgi:hypothetical protein